MSKHDWECVSHGMYDDKYRCKNCGLVHMESLDDPTSKLPEGPCEPFTEEEIHEAISKGMGFVCGPKENCPNGSEHDYSDWEEMESGGTAVCSKCGHRAIDDAWWY